MSLLFERKTLGYDVVTSIISSVSPFQQCIKLPNLLDITIFYTIFFELLKFMMSIFKLIRQFDLHECDTWYMIRDINCIFGT